MIKVQVISSLPRNFKRLVSSLQEGEFLRAAAFDSVALISNRIQQRGELTDGGKIGGGEYSESYAQVRAQAGRQTGFIDLTFTGDMLDRSFTVLPFDDGWGAGFTNAIEFEKMEFNEDRFGLFIHLSDEEISTVNNGINQSIDASFKKNLRD